MLQRDGVVMMVMKVLVAMVMMMMMIPMNSSSMTVTMATISPLQEGISPVDFCLPESFLSLCVYAPQRRRSLSVILSPVLGVGTPAYHPGFPLCIQFTIPGDRREST
jgi:hypothetical protein